MVVFDLEDAGDQLVKVELLGDYYPALFVGAKLNKADEFIVES